MSGRWSKQMNDESVQQRMGNPMGNRTRPGVFRPDVVLRAYLRQSVRFSGSELLSRFRTFASPGFVFRQDRHYITGTNLKFGH